MRGAFEFDVLACPRCGGRLRLIALIEEAAVIGRMLRHLGLLTACRSPGPPVRHRPSPLRARRRPTSTIGPLSDGSWPSICREVYPLRRPGVLDGCTRRLDTAAAGAIIGAPRRDRQSGSANPRRVAGLVSCPSRK